MIKKSTLRDRKTAIQELIKTHAIEDQSMLLALLEKQYGINTNQAAISRDLRNLGIFKRARGESMVYELPHVDIVTEILHYAVQSAHHNESLIVIKTVAGTAAFVGDFLDEQHDLPILGTIAGENTLFVTPRSLPDIPVLFELLCQRLKIKG